MNELIKQREWLTLDESVNYLLVRGNKYVLKTNLYRLALESKITLSIRFLEQVPVLIGKIIDEESFFSQTSDENTNYYDYDPRDFCDYCDSSDDSELCDDCKSFVPFSESDVLDSNEPVDDDTWFIYEDIPQNIGGVWDLTMLGLESEDIEKRYQDELGECSYIPEKANDRGILIRNDSSVCKLLKKLEPSPVLEDTVFINGVVKDFLVSKGFDIGEFFDNDFNTLDSLLTPSLLDELKTRIDLMSVSLPTNKRYENCFSIEDYNHQIVIRTEELIRFAESLRDSPKEGAAQETEHLYNKERILLLTLIEVLCNKVNVKPNRRGAVTPLIAMIELIGVSLSNGTVLKILKQINPKKKEHPENKKQLQKPLTTHGRNSFIVLIAALCKEANIDYKQIHDAANTLKELTEVYLKPLDYDQISNILNKIEAVIDSKIK